MIVLLDTGVLGILCNPNQKQKAINCQNWFEQLLARGVYFLTSVLCDYELRQGLILANTREKSTNGINKLNSLRNVVDFLPVTQEVAQIAAEIWAEARLQGKPTADKKNLDIDIIIAAHWQLLKREFPGRYIVISTTNVKHLSLFTEAEEWQNISY